MLPDTASVDGLRHLIEHIQDAVVAFELVDGLPVVRGVNEAFVEQFGYPREEVLGTDLNERIVPPWCREEASALDRRTASGDINYQQVQRQTASGLREFLYRGIPYTDSEDLVDGYAVYTDLTETTQRERQLKVLNRLLRHNLRNKASVIGGNVELLLSRVDTDDEETERAAREARGAAAELRELSDEAMQINRVLDSRTAGATAVDVVPIVRNVVGRFCNRFPAARITTDVPGSVSIVVATGFRSAIGGLVENAIEHNHAPDPQVLVQIEPGPEAEWLDLTVEDDGPLIPSADREVITGEAEITQTHHGRGLGLWLVKWTVERSGGRLSFEESDIGGNCVRLRLRRSESLSSREGDDDGR